MSRLLILTAGFGEGHNAAARNLAAAAAQLAGPDAATVVDLFALTSPRFNRLARRAYLAAINGSPRLWSGFYAWSHRSGILPRQIWMLRAERQTLRTLLARERPAVVCGTFPVYAFLYRRLAGAGVPLPPYYNVVTDSISIHSLWTGAGCAGWFVPNEETAEVMRRMAVPPGRLHALGFPVPAFFGEHARELAPPDLGAGAAPRVLYIIHSGVRHAGETARPARRRPPATRPRPGLDQRGAPAAHDPPCGHQQGRRRHHSGGHRRPLPDAGQPGGAGPGGGQLRAAAAP